MLKILQARLQQYVNRELPDVQAGFRKGRGSRDQIANIKKPGAQFFTLLCFLVAFEAIDTPMAMKLGSGLNYPIVIKKELSPNRIFLGV